jgi:hypothetical protein
MMPATVEAIAMPTIAPVERGWEDDEEGTVFVAVAVIVDVPVTMGGKARVGEMLILAQAERLEDKQQKEVALGEVRPQYVHNCGKLVPNPQFWGSFTNPSIHEELELILGLGDDNLSELEGRAQTVKSALTRPIRKSVKLEEFPPQNSGVITIVSSLVAKSAQVLAHTGGLNH